MPADDPSRDHLLAFVAIDLEFRVTAWGADAEQLFGRPAGEAVGRLAPDVYDADAGRWQRMAALRRDGRWHGVVTVADADGRHVAVEVLAEVALDGDGRAVGYEIRYWPAPDSPAYRDALDDVT